MVFIFTIYWWKFRKQPLKEVIDNYMAHCRRSKSVSRDFENDDEDDADDDQTRQEFEDFKRWLDEANPSSSQIAPSSVATCPKCKAKDCQWFPAESFWNFLNIYFHFPALRFWCWLSWPGFQKFCKGQVVGVYLYQKQLIQLVPSHSFLWQGAAIAQRIKALRAQIAQKLAAEPPAEILGLSGIGGFPC